MKLLVIYRPHSEHGRIVEEFIASYSARGHAGRMEIMDIDTREGAAIASLYDIMQYPSLLIVRDDGSIVRAWQGETLPLQNEVASYMLS